MRIHLFRPLVLALLSFFAAIARGDSVAEYPSSFLDTTLPAALKK